MARGELFLCLKVKDGSFLVDEVVCSVDSPVWRVSYSFETLDLLVYGLTVCLVISCASASFWFGCFLSQFGSSIYTFHRGSSSLRFLPPCGLCLGYTCLIFLEVRTWLSLSLIQHRCSIKVVMCGEQLKVIVEKKLVVSVCPRWLLECWSNIKRLRLFGVQVKVQLEKGPVLDVCFVMDCCRGFLKVFVVIVNGWFRCGYLLLMKKSSALCARLLSS